MIDEELSVFIQNDFVEDRKKMNQKEENKNLPPVNQFTLHRLINVTRLFSLSLLSPKITLEHYKTVKQLFDQLHLRNLNFKK